MTSEFNKTVFCVMVSFNPSLEGIKHSIESVLANHVKLVLVDNGSNNQQAIADFIVPLDGIILIPLSENAGIAFAQNRGIEYALEHGADFIWLSDQDTIYQHDFAPRMVKAFDKAGDKIAAIAPSFYDTNRGDVQPIVCLTPFTSKRLPEAGLNQVSHMIASGMFIPSSIMKLVGFKQESLFIDWVDIEWCWRATNQYKLKLYVTGDVEINHTLGDTNVAFLGKKVILRSPFRHYFMIRNAVYLALYSSVTVFPIRLELLAKAIIWTVLFPLLANNKVEQLNATFKGLFHGLVNKLGPKK